VKILLLCHFWIFSQVVLLTSVAWHDTWELISNVLLNDNVLPDHEIRAYHAWAYRNDTIMMGMVLIWASVVLKRRLRADFKCQLKGIMWLWVVGRHSQLRYYIRRKSYDQWVIPRIAALTGLDFWFLPLARKDIDHYKKQVYVDTRGSFYWLCTGTNSRQLYYRATQLLI